MEHPPLRRRRCRQGADERPRTSARGCGRRSTRACSSWSARISRRSSSSTGGGSCERLAERLNELRRRGPLVRAHHGSVARQQRAGDRGGAQGGRAARASSRPARSSSASTWARSISSCRSSRRAACRAGCSASGAPVTTSAALERDDPAEVPRRPARGDGRRAPHARRRGRGDPGAAAPLDVLAQQIVAMVAERRGTVDELERVVTRAPQLRGCRASCSTACSTCWPGRYPSDEFAELRPRLIWDRASDELIGAQGRAPARDRHGRHDPRSRHCTACTSAPSGPRIGELDEEMVAESRDGQTFMLGASTWRIVEITRDRVIVTPAPGEPGKMPFWRGEGPGRPLELGRALGAFCRELDAKRDDGDAAAGCSATTSSTRAPPTTCRLPSRAARGDGRAADRSHDHDRALPRRARRLARVHPVAVRQPRARAVGARARGAARGASSASRSSPCGPTTASCCASPDDDGDADRAAGADAARARARRGRGRCSSRELARSACSPPTSARTRRARCCCRAVAPASARRCGRSACARSS